MSIVFDALEASNAKTLSEITAKNFKNIIESVKNIDPESKAFE